MNPRSSPSATPNPAARATRRRRPVKILSNSSDQAKRLALWEGVSTTATPQYPQGTPLRDPLDPDFTIMRGPSTPSPTNPTPANPYLTIPYYRNQPLTHITAVPRETPAGASLRFAAHLNPNDCRYRYRRKGEFISCTITHLPQKVSITCTARCDTKTIRSRAEFRLANVLCVDALETELRSFFDTWADDLHVQIKEQRRRALSDSF